MSAVAAAAPAAPAAVAVVAAAVPANVAVSVPFAGLPACLEQAHVLYSIQLQCSGSLNPFAQKCLYSGRVCGLSSVLSVKPAPGRDAFLPRFC